MSDLNLTTRDARIDRDRLITRTDVLDKVGTLQTLPDDMHVTTEMVANFFEVAKETIFTVVRNNRDELTTDGYHVVTRADFEGTFDLKVPSTASRFALFPRRAVLRVGMLLRDSPVARQLRDYLLDVEAFVTAVAQPTQPIAGTGFAAVDRGHAEVQLLREARDLVDPSTFSAAIGAVLDRALDLPAHASEYADPNPPLPIEQYLRQRGFTGVDLERAHRLLGEAIEDRFLAQVRRGSVPLPRPDSIRATDSGRATLVFRERDRGFVDAVWASVAAQALGIDTAPRN